MVRPPIPGPKLSPLGERAAEAAERAAAVRGGGEAAQRRRDRLEAEALAAELLDRQDRLRPPGHVAPESVASPAGIAPALPGYIPGAAPWQVGLWGVLSGGRYVAALPARAPAAAQPAARRSSRDRAAEAARARRVADLEAYALQLRRFIAGQGPAPHGPF
jgi:hypothetical protein